MTQTALATITVLNTAANVLICGVVARLGREHEAGPWAITTRTTDQWRTKRHRTRLGRDRYIRGKKRSNMLRDVCMRMCARDRSMQHDEPTLGAIDVGCCERGDARASGVCRVPTRA